MKQKRRDGEIFSISFLDVICCSFGAMVLLVLLSKNDVVGEPLQVDLVQKLLDRVIAEKKKKTDSEQAHERLSEQIRTLQDEFAALEEPAANPEDLQQRIADNKKVLKELQRKSSALERHSAKKTATVEKEQVGGIPVDSNYIIFIVDTSGSMQEIWPRVMRELENVLNIHPRVKGFQIMNDNGTYLIKSYGKKWISDTPGRRKAVLAAMRIWSSFSNSSPVEGLNQALKTYAKSTDKLAVYIFGDDYSGGSYDPVLDTITKLNTNFAGQPIARIHGIGFQRADYGTDRFATLMREIARRNRGAFVALEP